MFKPMAVIFDMDGLMLDTERVGCVAYKQAASRMGYDVANEIYLRTIGRDDKDTRLIFMEHYGNQFPYEAFHKQWLQYRENIFGLEGVGIKPGLLELLDHMDRQNVRVAVATSTARARAHHLLVSVNLARRFHAVVCGDEIVSGKPSPDIFLKAANALDVRPADCIVLEDSESGVLAAHAAGMRAIVVPDLRPPPQEIAQLAWATCASLHEVRGLFLENSAYSQKVQ